jgi:hypothetical protein
MRKNVIILTVGLSGSSVLTGLISRAGYWTGAATAKKEYDTFENLELVGLNQKLIKEAGYRGDYTSEFSEEAVTQLKSVYKKVDNAPYKQFLLECEYHKPWIWKDPRLWLTIPFWKNLLDLDQCKFIVLSRDLLQSWTSIVLRRQVWTYGYLKHYENSIRGTITNWLEQNSIPYLHLHYEDLILCPEKSLESLNRYLNIALTLQDIQAIYNQPLYRKPRSNWDFVKAVAIYVKNYPERLR